MIAPIPLDQLQASRVPTNSAPQEELFTSSVLLALHETQMESALFSAALSLCERVEGVLEILWVSASATPPQPLSAFLDDLASTSTTYAFCQSDGLFWREVGRYTSARPQIRFVVVNAATAGLKPKSRGKAPWDEWLHCPVVVITPQQNEQHPLNAQA